MGPLNDFEEVVVALNTPEVLGAKLGWRLQLVKAGDHVKLSCKLVLDVALEP